jgi:flagellar hook-basal body complex protein FliE
MAAMPQASFSTARLKNIGRRVCRLCAQSGNGAQKYSDTITAALNELDQKHTEAEEKALEMDAAHDLAVHSDRILDDAVRTARDQCLEYERSNGFVPVVEKVFPDSMITPIIKTNRVKEHGQVRQVVNRIREIAPEGGRLADIADALEKVLDVAIKAQEALAEKTLKCDDAKTAESLGRVKFIEQYNGVYHDACHEFGRRRAEYLFPDSPGRKNTADEESKINAEETTAAK